MAFFMVLSHFLLRCREDESFAILYTYFHHMTTSWPQLTNSKFYVIAPLEHVFMFLNVIADVIGKTVLDKKIDESRKYVDTSFQLSLHIG
jgi:hypothetical protein